jgi:hypothetical protein
VGSRRETPGKLSAFTLLFSLVAIASFIALWRYKIDILWVIAGCALFGLAQAVLI